MLGDTCMIFSTQRGKTYTILCMLCNDAFKSLRCVADQSISPALLFVTPWTTARQAPLSFTISQSLLKFISTELVVPSNHLILYFCLQFFPTPWSFPMSQLFASGGQSIGLVTWFKFNSMAMGQTHCLPPTPSWC